MSQPEPYHEMEEALIAPHLPDEAEWWTAAPTPTAEDLADTAKANALLRALGAIERKDLADREVVADEIARLNDWLEAALAARAPRAEWLRRWLANWHAAHLSPHPDGAGKTRGPKTIELPAGTLRAKDQQIRVEVEDPDVFVKWAQEHRPELVRHPPARTPPPAPDGDALRKLAKQLNLSGLRPGESTLIVDGDEQLPGVRVEVQGPQFTISPGGIW